MSSKLPKYISWNFEKNFFLTAHNVSFPSLLGKYLPIVCFELTLHYPQKDENYLLFQAILSATKDTLKKSEQLTWPSES